MLEKALESPLDCKEIQAVNPKGNQSWIVTGRTDVEVEALILWPPDTKNWFITKDPDARKDWRQEEKGMTEDKMVGWYHRLDGYEFEQALGIGDGQGSLVCCIPCGRKELDMTEQLNWIDEKDILTQFISVEESTYMHWQSSLWTKEYIRALEVSMFRPSNHRLSPPQDVI